jgi:hypothetical protein
MLNPALERAVVALAHDDVHVSLVLIDERFPQRCQISRRRFLGLPILHRQQDEGLPGLPPSTDRARVRPRLPALANFSAEKSPII